MAFTTTLKRTMNCRRFRSLMEFALGLLALSPVITSILGWNVDGNLTLFEYRVRAYSYIVVAVECAVVLLAVLSGANLTSLARRFKRWQVLMLVLIAIAAFASASSIGMYESEVTTWTATGLWLIHFLFAYSLLTLALEYEIVVTDIFWWLLVSAALAYTALVIFFVFAVPDPASFPWVARMPGVINVRHIGYFVAPAMAVTIGFYFTEHARRFTLLGIIAILACFGSWTGSRGIFFSVALSIAFALVLFSELRIMRHWLALAASIVIGVMASAPMPTPTPAFGLVHRVDQVVGPNAPEFSSGRIRIWKCTLAVVSKNPLVGYGAGMYREMMSPRLGTLNHPHNFILQILFQWGIAGAVGLFSLIIAVWLKAMRTAMRIGVQAVPAVLVLNTLLAFSMFDGTGYYPLPITIMVLAVAAIFSYSRREAESQPA